MLVNSLLYMPFKFSEFRLQYFITIWFTLHSIQILDKEAVEEVKAKRDIPDLRPGYIIQLKVVICTGLTRWFVCEGFILFGVFLDFLFRM